MERWISIKRRTFYEFHDKYHKEMYSQRLTSMILLTAILFTSSYVAFVGGATNNNSAAISHTHHQSPRSVQQLTSTATSILYSPKSHPLKQSPSTGNAAAQITSSDIISQYTLPNDTGKLMYLHCCEFNSKFVGISGMKTFGILHRAPSTISKLSKTIEHFSKAL